MDDSKVTCNILKLLADRSTNDLAACPMLFGHGQELFSCYLPICPWFAGMTDQRSMQRVDDILQFFTRFVQQTLI